MKTQYINIDTHQRVRWIAQGLCSWCGSLRDTDQFDCFCRYCTSCQELWKSDELAEMENGKPKSELCPDCAGEAMLVECRRKLDEYWRKIDRIAFVTSPYNDGSRR